MTKINDSITITPETIDDLFSHLPPEPGAYILPLFNLLLPPDTRYQDIAQFTDYPHAGDALFHYLWDKIVTWDKAHTFDHIPGGYWLNYGWSIDTSLPPWTAICPPYTLLTKEAHR